MGDGPARYSRVMINGDTDVMVGQGRAIIRVVGEIDINGRVGANAAGRMGGAAAVRAARTPTVSAMAAARRRPGSGAVPAVLPFGDPNAASSACRLRSTRWSPDRRSRCARRSRDRRRRRSTRRGHSKQRGGRTATRFRDRAGVAPRALREIEELGRCGGPLRIPADREDRSVAQRDTGVVGVRGAAVGRPRCGPSPGRGSRSSTSTAGCSRHDLCESLRRSGSYRRRAT